MSVLSCHFACASENEVPLASLRPSNTSREKDPNAFLSSAAYVGDIEFPATRSILWDRRPLADAQIMHADDAYIPTASIAPSALSAILESIANAADALDVLGYASFSEVASSTNWTLQVNSFHRGALPSHKAGSVIPVYSSVVASSSDQATACHHAALAQDFDRVVEANELQSSSGLSPYLSLQLAVQGISSGQLAVQLSALGPATSLSLIPIRNLPLLLTPLAKLLMKAGSTVPQSWGYVTLDKTRKVVPLLQSDPVASSRPLVGVWVRSLSASHLYLASLLFGRHSSTRQKLWIAPRTFLLVKYPLESTQWLPEFFECTLSDSSSPGFFTARQTWVPDSTNAPLDLSMSRSVFPTALPSFQDATGEVIASPVVQRSMTPSRHDEPVVTSHMEASSFDMPTPVPQRDLPVPHPHSKPPQPRVTPEPVHMQSSNPQSDFAALLEKQTRTISAMKEEITSLQNQLKALRDVKKDVCTIGTNTSFVGPPETLTEFRPSQCDSDNESDADDAEPTGPPLVGNGIDARVASPPANSVAPPSTSLDVPRIRIPPAQTVDESDDDMSEIEAKYLRHRN